MKKQPDKGKITALYERLSHDDERTREKSQPCTSVFPMTMSEPGKACR